MLNGSKNGGIVQSDIAGRMRVFGDGFYQGALARLPGSIQEENRRIGERIQYKLSDISIYHG